MRFYEIISEDANRGKSYERDTAWVLKTLGFGVKVTDDNSPDPDLLVNNVGVELKVNDDVSAGSLVIVEVDDMFSGPGNKKYEMSSSPGLEKDIIRQVIKNIDLQKAMERLYTSGKDMYKEIDPDVVSKYYSEKNCDYINIGTHGLYSLGGRDRLNWKKLGGLPELKDVARVMLRIRNKTYNTFFNVSPSGQTPKFEKLPKNSKLRKDLEQAEIEWKRRGNTDPYPRIKREIRPIATLELKIVGKKSNYNLASYGVGDEIQLERTKIPGRDYNKDQKILQQTDLQTTVDTPKISKQMNLPFDEPDQSVQNPNDDYDDLTPSM